MGRRRRKHSKVYCGFKANAFHSHDDHCYRAPYIDEDMQVQFTPEGDNDLTQDEQIELAGGFQVTDTNTNTGTYPGKTQYMNNWETSCFHTGRITLFKIGDLQVSGGARKDIDASFDVPTLLLNCSGYSNPSTDQIILPVGFEALAKHVVPTAAIDMQWPDGGTPAVTPEFWRKLPELALKKGFLRMIVYCMGSHGRTGTALASLLIANHGLSAQKAVVKIRKEHCMDAVESSVQVDYLQDVELWAYQKGLVTDVSTARIKPSYSWKYSGYTKGGTSQPTPAGSILAPKGTITPNCVCSHSQDVHNYQGGVQCRMCTCDKYVTPLNTTPPSTGPNVTLPNNGLTPASNETLKENLLKRLGMEAGFKLTTDNKGGVIVSKPTPDDCKLKTTE